MLAFASLLRPRTDHAAGAHSRSGRVGPGCPGLRWPGGGRRGNAGALPHTPCRSRSDYPLIKL